MKIERFGPLVCRWFAIAILLGLVAGCSGEDTGEQFLRLQGPPHQRLKWKAEDFFTDAGVLSLCKAIEARDVKEIDRLGKSGVDVNTKGRANMTPLMWAFPMGEEVFKKMLELGANPNVQLTERPGRLRCIGFKKGKSVMSASVELADGIVHNQYFHDVGMDNYLQLVLTHGGNPNLEDTNGDTAIFYTVNYGHRSEKIRLLLSNGADIDHQNRQGETPLMNAMPPFQDNMMILLEAGADYRLVDNWGWDLILSLERLKIPQQPGAQDTAALERQAAQAKPVFDWLTNEGVNWDVARTALKDKDLMKNLKNLPADYKHRPWLPQRPTLKKLDK